MGLRNEWTRYYVGWWGVSLVWRERSSVCLHICMNAYVWGHFSPL